ncbi:MAG TPA: hypothetical protein VG735_07965 [Caulobacterales bacterium]|nr:hypothetical protein [Caulobacterales bacterium]
MSKVSDALVQLTADVEAEGAVVDSAVAAINGIPAVVAAAVAEALAQAGVDDATAAAAVAAADSAVQAQSAKLTAALTANTPEAPPA